MVPTRVLYVVASGEKGGMEENLLNEIRHLDRARTAPAVVCLEAGPLVAALGAAGAVVHLVPRGRLRRPGRGLAAITSLAMLIVHQHVEVVVCENAVAHLYGVLAARVTGRPRILRVGGVGRPPDIAERVAYRLGADTVVANSEFTCRALVEAGVEARRIRVIHRGVDLGVFGGCRGEAIRRELGIDSVAPVVTVSARLQHGKGIHVFLRAARQVTDEYPGAVFLVVGGALFGLEAEYPASLRVLARELGLESAVRFTGHREDVAHILAASDLVVVPSLTPEGFGMATVEAMAARKAVVATGIGATVEIIEHGATGFLVPPDDPQTLAAAVSRLLADPGLRLRLGEAARARVAEKFTLDRAIAQYEDLYAAAAGHAGRAA